MFKLKQLRYELVHSASYSDVDSMAIVLDPLNESATGIGVYIYIAPGRCS